MKQVELKVNIPNECIINGCQYSGCDTGYIEIRFLPETIEPGETTFITLWSGEFPFPENPFYTLSKYFSYAPTVGQLTQVNNYTYKYVAPNNIQDDSLVVNFDYLLARWGCWGKYLEEIETDQKKINECPWCPPFTSRGMWYDKAISQLVVKWDSLYVALEPEEVYPGDTVQVVIKKRKPDGTLVDFPPEQTYEIAKLEGCMLGNILVGDDSGSYFYDVSQPIYFAAADTLVGDSTGTVLLQVGLVDNVKKKELPSDHPKVIESNDCFLGPFISQNKKDIRQEINPPLMIFYPTNSDTMWITDEPRMPVIRCVARYGPFYPRTIKYEWKFVVWKSYERKGTDGKPICSRISRSEFQGKSYSDGNGFTFWTVPFIKDSAYFYFKAISHRPRKLDGYGCKKEITRWYENDLEIFTGGEVFISLTAKDYQTGNILAFLDSISTGKILGKNMLDDYKIINYMNDSIVRAIKEVESFNYQFEFDVENSWPYNGIGWPIYGPPNGYGLMQLDDPTATESQLWNWKSNIDAGKSLFYLIKSHTDSFLNKHPSNVTNEMKLKCAYQKYNFFGYDKNNKMEHYYYKWNKSKKRWEEDDFVGTQRKRINGSWIDIKYGELVYLKYLEINKN